ncbi:MAG: hypothetical protein HDR01_01865 [Lachnospiraceae bacterium]|nr:hypothetical protein [Lachnospiraceae bacterium]
MKGKNHIYYVYLNCRTNLLKRFINFLLLCTSFLMIILVSFAYFIVNERECAANRIIVGGNGNLGTVRILNDTDDEGINFIEEMKKKGFSYIGQRYYIEIIMSGFEELAAQQNEFAIKKTLIKNDHIEDDSTSIICVPFYGDFPQLCGVELSEGSWETNPKEDERYLYLGSEFQDIPIGTVYFNRNFVAYSSDEKGIKYIVKGYLAEGSKILSDKILTSRDLFNLHYGEVLDDKVIMFDTHPIAYDTCFLTNGKSNDEVNAILDEISKETGVEIEKSDWKEVLKEQKEENWILIKNISYFLVITILICISVLLCNTLAEKMNNRNVIGIWYANGFGQKDIFLIEALDSILPILFSAGLAIFFSYFALQTQYNQWVEYIGKQRISDLIGIYSKSYCLLAAVVLFLCLMLTWVKAVQVRNRKPIDYIRGETL